MIWLLIVLLETKNKIELKTILNKIIGTKIPNKILVFTELNFFNIYIALENKN